MQHEPPNRDLLAEWQRDRSISLKRRRVLAVSATAVLAVLSVVEIAAFGTLYVMTGACLILLGLAGIGISLGYGGFLFYLGWQYAKWCQDRGQVRPRIWQPLALTVISAVAVVPIGGLMLREEADATFLWVVAIFAWTNALASNLGFGAEFWTRAGIRPNDENGERA